MWNSESGNLIRTFADGERVETLAFSPDGKTLLTGGERSAARLWDIRHGALRAELEGHEGAVRSAAYSPDVETYRCRGTKTERYASGTPRRLS